MGFEIWKPEKLIIKFVWPYLPITEVCRVLNLTIAVPNVFALHAFDLREHPRISVDYTEILGVPALPWATLIEILN